MNSSFAQVGSEKFDSLEAYVLRYKEWCAHVGRNPNIFGKVNGKGRNMIVHHCTRTSDGVKRYYDSLQSRRASVIVSLTVKEDGAVKMDMQTAETNVAKGTKSKAPDQSFTGRR